jgi:hypothetical protein
MERCLFEIYDPTSEKVLASRQQFPLRLTYAMTVHRAQGQSIQYLDVDCYSFFAPGPFSHVNNLSHTVIVNYFITIMHDYVSVMFISKCVSTTFQIIQWLHTI